MKTIEITVSPSGESKVETKGFHGAACQEASRFLEQALGGRLSEQLSTEYYQTESHAERHLERS